RVLAFAGGALLLVVLFVSACLWRTLPPGHVRVSIPGLSRETAITLDEHGVPRIHGASLPDAAAALGFLHARDRMFQMELMRRLGSGRLSELAGSGALPIDRQMRVLGLRHLAEAAYPTLPAPVRAELDAYARGVNAAIASRGRFIAPEFLLLGRPEPWTPADTLLWGRLMAVTLSGNWRTELARFANSARTPVDRLLSLWPDRPHTPAPDAPASPSEARGAAALLAAIPRFPAPYTLPDEASDEWAVDGTRSATGGPLLAGDPHLALGFPAIWYLARIDVADAGNGVSYALSGATAPGVPFLVIGQNGHLAWTFTSSSADTQDLFRETALPDGRYATPDGSRPFDLRRETIHVRGAPDETLLVRATRNGPVLSDVLPHRPGDAVLSLAAENLRVADAAPGLAALDLATDVDAATRAATLIASPVQNLLVADRTRIALLTTGTVPVRRGGDGAFPANGADAASDWIADRTGDALPVIVAPPSGQLLNANERTAPPDFPVFLGRDWLAPWRADRIRTLLAARPRHDVAGFAAMQVDTGSAYAAEILPTLLSRPLPLRPDEPASRALSLLRSWNRTVAADAPQPLILDGWMQRFAATVIERNGIVGATGPWEDLTALLLSPAGASWCGGDCTPWLAAALRDSVAAIARTEGTDPAAWRWDRVHRAVFDNAFLDRIPLVRRLARATVPIPGDDTTLFRGGSGELGDFAARHGGAYRGVYDLSDPERSRFSLAPGQSGNWLSPMAWNLMRDWSRGTTMSLPREPARVSAVITLEPAGGGT
ncbi:MAG: penicillin acylase family protein, partial [Gluconacetobacter diazotrophicus]|nr:penicillin acylase family protein [Gluconacetobacter diazotrophicus]